MRGLVYVATLAVACISLNLLERRVLLVRRSARRPGPPLHDILHDIDLSPKQMAAFSLANDVAILLSVAASIGAGGLLPLATTVSTCMLLRFVTIVVTQIPPPRPCSYKIMPSFHGQCEELFPSGHVLWMAASLFYLARRSILTEKIAWSVLLLSSLTTVIVRNHYTIDVITSVVFVMAFQ